MRVSVKSGSINSRVLRLAGPSILANITVPLVGIVDLAIAGHLGEAACIGGIAIGSMLFDLLYWNMGFLRVGTAGITAQAYGRQDWETCINTFFQGIATALLVALICLVIQWGYAALAFMAVDCSSEVEVIARDYFFIRIWAVPATLSLFVFKGWFIGMQNTIYPMITDIWVNLSNIVVSWFLAFHTPLGINGVAVGTVIAQWSGALLALVLMLLHYRKLIPEADLHKAIRWTHIRNFFTINVHLFIRSLSMLVVYCGFTVFATRFGDVQLAVSEVMMKLLLFYSYFVDGFAYAGEALVGRFIGEHNPKAVRGTIRCVFFWAFVISAVSTAAYALFPRPLVQLLTDNAEVVEACGPFLFWLLLMPVMSCIAFTWDGIYTGATESSQMMWCTIIAAVLFLIAFFTLQPALGIQALYVAYFVHLVARSAYMTFRWPHLKPYDKF